MAFDKVVDSVQLDGYFSSIANKIREKKYTDTQMTPTQMVNEIDELGYGINNIDINIKLDIDDWVRPQNYPNVDLLDRTDLNGVYLTYDLSKTEGYGWIGLGISTTKANTIVNIERGYINQNNEFVADYHTQMTIGTTVLYFRENLDEENGIIQLWKIWTLGGIQTIRFATNTATNVQNLGNGMQPCVERYGRLPNMTSCYTYPLDTTNNRLSFSTSWLQSDNICDATSLTDFHSAWSDSYNLQHLVLNNIDTHLIKDFSSCFRNCYSLKNIPVQNFNTLSATSFASMFYNCYNVKELDVSNFNIDNVTTLAEMFYSCRTLTTLKTTNFQGVGKLTNISSMFYCCHQLDNIQNYIKNLNVTNVTSINYTFNYCYNLKKLDLSNWNITSKLTTMSTTFAQDHNLQFINIDNWDVSNVESMASCFNECYKLRKISWKNCFFQNVTNLNSTFSNCRSIEEINLSNFNIAKLTTTASLFYCCFSLKSVNFNGWNIQNKITTMANMFYYCLSIDNINMSNWQFTVPVAINDMFNSCRSLKTFNVHNWKFNKITAISGLFSNCWSLNKIQITDWIVEDPYLTAKNTVNNLFQTLYNCKSIVITFSLIMENGSQSYLYNSEYMKTELIDLRNWDISSSSNVYSVTMRSLKEYYPPKLPELNQNYSSCYNLSKASLLRIFNQLPVATTTRTLTLGQRNKLKLTAEEIAIVTQKGWTVA